MYKVCDTIGLGFIIAGMSIDASSVWEVCLLIGIICMCTGTILRKQINYGNG